MAAPTAYPLPFAMEAWDNRIQESRRHFSHIHGGHELNLVLDPGTILIHRDAQIAAPPGTLCLHHPEEVHGIVGDGSPVRMIVLNYEPDERFESGLPNLARDSHRVWHLDDQQRAAYIDLHSRVQAELDGRHLGREQAASAWLRLLLVLVGRLTQHRAAAAAPRTSMEAVDAEVHRLRRAIDLRRQGSSTASLREMVENYDALRHRFRVIYGESPNQMLMRLRIDMARGLLSTTDESMAEIAQKVGYARQHEFARAFHRAVGCTPSAFRRQHRGR